jgi:hypothetical protein
MAGRAPLGILLLVMSVSPAQSKDFSAGPVNGLLNLNLSYGALYRTENRNQDIVAIANGGRSDSANIDDGTLNYDKGLASSTVGTRADLVLNWGPFSAVTRGIAFYDFEQEKEERKHRQFESADLDAVGSDAEIRDFYLTTRLSPGGMPIILRVGDQVVNWGSTTFVRDGVDVINALDLIGQSQPARAARDIRVAQGMIWAAANLTETFTVESYYQYEWRPVPLPPAGYFLSTVDILGEGRRKFFQLGAGRFSDLGTDLDAAFRLPPGTLGFDERFLQLPQRNDDQPDDDGQYGFALTRIANGVTALKWGIHYIRYHSRLPFIGGLTGDQAAIDATEPQQVDAIAGDLAPLYLEQGLTGEEALEAAGLTASQLVLSDYANAAGYYLDYPEDISMIAATMETATLHTGTLVAAEISYHMDAPLQLDIGSVINAALSPVQFNPDFGSGPLGSYGADERVPGYVRLDRTQFAFSALQILGPRLGSIQTLVGVDGAFVHIHDLPGSGEPQLNAPGGGDRDSWGYRVLAQLNYANILGAVNLSPRIAFSHDVRGHTPAPYSTFWEGRKALNLGIGGDLINRLTADLSYTLFFGGGSDNPIQDRDFIRFNVTYWF